VVGKAGTTRILSTSARRQGTCSCCHLSNDQKRLHRNAARRTPVWANRELPSHTHFDGKPTRRFGIAPVVD
jgi:hypothetical protein